MKRFLPTACAVVCLCPFVAAADTLTLSLNPIVVTPGRSVQTVEESLSSVTVIDRETLDRQQPREFVDILQGQPGIGVVTNGAFGKNTTVFTRGAGSESTVLLINGIRIRSATAGGAPWQFIPPQLLDRVEVVRGPRSSIYGADAVGGVIQGFTAEGEGAPRGWVQGGFGSNSSREIGAGTSGRVGDTSFSVAGNRFDTDGIDIREGEERKGYDNTAGIGSLRQHFDNGASVGVTGFRAQGNTEFDTGDTDYVIQTIGLSGELPVGDNWITEFSLSEGQDRSLTDGTSRFDTRSRTVRIANRVFLGPHELVVGADQLRDEITSDTAYAEDSRDNRGFFSQLFLRSGPSDMQLSARWDDNEAFGDRLTGAAAVGHALDGNHRVRLSYGTAFRAPTFNDLYFPGFGNPDLSPERSQTAELGMRGQYQTVYWDVAAFQTYVDDLIGFDVDLGAPGNVERARIHGVELEAGMTTERWDLRATGTLQDPRNRDTGARLTRRTTQSARLDLDRRFGQFSLGASGVAVGDRYNDAANNDRLSGFGLVNLRAGWAFAENWSARITVDNMFDREYVVSRFFDGTPYNQTGRTAFLSVRYGHR
ncbi:vitamin B12 transporter [Natronocella acetinitrilica]|uniref:Vitamin B12 transporter n=1 Tax=Natronocella acetinitrilica TaxID=414046 RepID=A0AAE3G3J2_9GAMM|nr:TonB-dependent receptor [Natronocella acetinitrilica]MCP1673257.1 vitamin B12 transporter [Natronocella acetinitrilica]